MSDETSAGDSGAALPEVPSAPAVPVETSASEVIEVTEAMPPEIAQEVVLMPEVIPQVVVPEILPEIVPEVVLLESGEVPAPQTTASQQNQPPQPAASAAPPPATPAAPQSHSPAIKDRRPEALEAKQSRKRANLDKIMQLVATEGTIKNDDVEKLLHVSDSTAQRYLAHLVKEGKLVRVGKPRHASYRLP